MPRKPRIEYEGAAYHLMSRGNAGEAIFGDDEDRREFLLCLEEVCERTGWEIHSYVLLENHYHLLTVTPEANVVAGMKNGSGCGAAGTLEALSFETTFCSGLTRYSHRPSVSRTVGARCAITGCARRSGSWRWA